MSDLRSQLDREARRISAKPDALESMHRRAERRHRNRRLMAGGTALVLVAAVGLGAWNLLGDRGTTRLPGGEVTTPASAPPTEPGTAADAETAAREFAMREYGWPEVHFDDSMDGDFGGLETIRLYVSSCDTLAVEGCEGMSTVTGGDEESLLELGRRGDGWVVTTHWGPLAMEFAPRTAFGRLPTGGWECPAGPFADLPDQQLLDAGQAYLEAANAALPDAGHLWDNLTPEVRAQFEHREFFVHQVEKADVGPHATWNLDGVSADWPFDMEETERCGQEVRDATSAVIVSFPASSFSQPIALLFVETPDGPRYWKLRQP